MNFEEAALPKSLAKDASEYPFPLIAERARTLLASAAPTLAEHLADIPIAVFGLTGGFFYLTSAQGRAWGMDEAAIIDVLTLQALGHFHFAFQDSVIDEGHASPVMCLLSDVCLLSYLDGLATMAPESAAKYRQLHGDYYGAYVAAIGRDLAHRKELRPYTAEEILALGDKAAPGGTMLHLVADLARRSECAAPAVAALLRLCTGLQLLDDLHDCAGDAAAGNLTWPVTSALIAYPEMDLSDPEAIMAAVVGSGAAGACVRLAAGAFEDARRLARDADASVLAELARSWHERAATRARRLTEVLENAGIPL